MYYLLVLNQIASNNGIGLLISAGIGIASIGYFLKYFYFRLYYLRNRNKNATEDESNKNDEKKESKFVNEQNLEKKDINDDNKCKQIAIDKDVENNSINEQIIKDNENCSIIRNKPIILLIANKNHKENNVVKEKEKVMNNQIEKNEKECLPYLSISVGNTNTSAVIIKNSFSKIVTQFDGKYFESAVSFNRTNDSYKISLESKIKKYTVASDMMKYIGKKYDEINSYNLVDKPYKLIKGKNDYCEYEVFYNNRIRHYTPTEVLSMLLKFIKKTAILQSVNDFDGDLYPVILTIPADFTNVQRKEMEKAAKEAGLKVEKLISEPIAASFAYLHNKSIEKDNCNILVCDFGENSFESSIFNLNNQKMKVISSSRDDYLGGKDVSKILEDYIINNIKEKFKLGLNDNDKLKIHKKCEEAKIALSKNDFYHFYIPLNNYEYSNNFSRESFNRLCEDFLQMTIRTINKSIDYGKVKEIDYVILIGESSNIPRFQQIIKDCFKDSTVYKSSNPQDLLAEGSCWYFHSQSSSEKKYKIIDVLLRSLNVGLKQNKNIKLTYGIDLGTTYSSSAYIDVSNAVQIVPDASGNNSIPSCVYYDNNSTIKVGEPVKQMQKYKSVKNLLYDSKRFIGKKYEEIPKSDIESYPFELIEVNTLPKYKLEINNNSKTPVDVSSEILKYIHKYSIPFITHKSITNDDIEVVIGVPAAFTKEQREATKESAYNAGFKNIDLLSEPTAAALSYIFKNEIEKNECKMLIYDFGVEHLM